VISKCSLATSSTGSSSRPGAAVAERMAATVDTRRLVYDEADDSFFK
jgi:hypothetical protein